MSASLGDRPDLNQLRRRAKELRDAARLADPQAIDRITRQHPRRAEPVTLAAAQLVIAREHGFASWPKMKAALDAGTEDSRRRVQEFLTASLEGRAQLAVDLLQDDPAVAGLTVFTAAVFGDARRVAELMAGDPALALGIDLDRGWPPLLYVCYSQWHSIHAEREAGLAAVAYLLLAAGASPNTNNGGRPNHSDYRSALLGAVSASNPEIIRLLLEQGANPNDRVSLRRAVQQRDHGCLRLLVMNGATTTGTWALETAINGDDAEAVGLLLEAAGRTDTAERVADLASHALADAAQSASVTVVETLLAYGADPNMATAEGSPLRRATRAGRLDVAEILVSQGATEDLTDIDRFLGSCGRADRTGAERLLVEQPGLLNRLSDADRSTVVETAGRPDTAAVSLMLELGFSPHARNDLGETALHAAAFEGRAETVRLLLNHGAEIDALDATFDSTPLAHATVGSGEHLGAGEGWVATVRILVDAGASRQGAWVSNKAPSDQVAKLLRSYGITEDDTVAPNESDDNDESAVPDPGVIDEIAENIRVAYETADLELFASLLHRDVTWGGGVEGCTSRSQVLEWYGGLLALGIGAQVASLQVRGDAVVIDVTVVRAPEGARPRPPETVQQVFRISDGMIVDITG
ncbi:MAG: ankyrin repeat domain-containing protein [Actinomycetota bacterium]|nr:ankyrin repeat domain-containing protein [Actinomycetota bacterium]